MNKCTHQYTIFGERVGKPRSKANDCRATLAGIVSEAIELEAFWRLLSHDRTTIIATSDQSLPPEETIRHLLDSRTGVTIATAESCTGGLVVARLTSVPGSSVYMKGGIVAYANDAKERLLGVPANILASPGAVSPECAIAMAEGARDRLGATWAISTTGIAGPDGGTDRKPVGLVYIGLAGPDGTTVERHVFPGDRQAIVTAACDRALAMLVEAVADVDST